MKNAKKLDDIDVVFVPGTMPVDVHKMLTAILEKRKKRKPLLRSKKRRKKIKV